MCEVVYSIRCGVVHAAQIDVTMTAKADYAWLWGFQTAVESIFIAQAKDDIAKYMDYNIKLFQEKVDAGEVGSCNLPFHEPICRSSCAPDWCRLEVLTVLIQALGKGWRNSIADIHDMPWCAGAVTEWNFHR